MPPGKFIPLTPASTKLALETQQHAIRERDGHPESVLTARAWPERGRRRPPGRVPRSIALSAVPQRRVPARFPILAFRAGSIPRFGRETVPHPVTNVLNLVPNRAADFFTTGGGKQHSRSDADANSGG